MGKITISNNVSNRQSNDFDSRSPNSVRNLNINVITKHAIFFDKDKISLGSATSETYPNEIIAKYFKSNEHGELVKIDSPRIEVVNSQERGNDYEPGQIQLWKENRDKEMRKYRSYRTLMKSRQPPFKVVSLTASNKMEL